MQFLNPIWFWAAATVVIPLLIHLWNIKPGRVLKVGSISLIEQASRKSSRSFKLNDTLLLILRCIFLILIAALLARPFLEQNKPVKKSKGWVLLPREDVNRGYRTYKKSIDSLLQAGYEFHYFNDSLPKAELAKLIKDKALPKDTAKDQHTDYWSLIKQLDTKVAADVPVYLYTSNGIRHFIGEKPSADLDLHCKIFAEADSTAQWIQNAWFMQNKDICVVKGTSDKNGVNYTYIILPPDKGNSEYKISTQNGKAIVSLNNAGNSGFAVDTAIVKVAIYSDHFQPDAGYLKAALDAAAGFNQRQTVIKQYSNPALIPAGQTWIFWLSEQPVPARLVQNRVKILSYQPGKQNAVATSIGVGNAVNLPSGESQVSLFKIVGNLINSDNYTWHDGYGNAVLSREDRKGATVYYFNSHFSPGWNDLVWDSSFPRMILKLLNDTPQKDISVYDKRVLTAAQLQAAKTTEKNLITGKFSARKDLVNYFWYALVLVFFAERWLATSNKLAQNNG